MNQLAQVQEMLYIEKGGEEQLKDELAAYNPLVPNGKELTATLMFEIDNPVSRAAFLGKVGGIEEKVFMKVEGEKIKAVPEEAAPVCASLPKCRLLEGRQDIKSLQLSPIKQRNTQFNCRGRCN